MIGKPFGKLVVLSVDGRTARVRCECGVEKIVDKWNLIGGRTRSCGCGMRVDRSGTPPDDVAECRWLAVGNGRFALVDEDVYSEASRCLWSVAGEGYVMRHLPSPGGMERLSHFVLGVSSCVLVDHKNLDRLDNRRDNLRVADKSKNSANAKMRRNNTSGFKGVSKLPGGKFGAYIRVRGESRYLGTYITAEEAARVYDAAAVEAFGDFARGNFTKERA